MISQFPLLAHSGAMGELAMFPHERDAINIRGSRYDCMMYETMASHSPEAS
jgi:hypothetical protein